MSVTLTTEVSWTLVKFEKLDWPKKEPPIACLSFGPGASNALEFPQKLRGVNWVQYPGAPYLQLWHSPQNAKESSTESPGLTFVTPFPTRITYPALDLNVSISLKLNELTLTFVPKYTRIRRNWKADSVWERTASQVRVANTTSYDFYEHFTLSRGVDLDIFQLPLPMAIPWRVTHYCSCKIWSHKESSERDVLTDSVDSKATMTDIMQCSYINPVDVPSFVL
ncbi:hypothetical protein PV08_06562 [Exophiala spinifera]|uniref:Uncharacterized protein n=1 Tax=Exophiala spinifera TaxID=91928 RepID=A0A0D1ZUY2_9EURO|nr:uncharacterized protein PV08_06562 [Exophiala spinifera]KIW16507.1 hypothetical protein PV08_06562 [Exophiala spinifera]